MYTAQAVKSVSAQATWRLPKASEIDCEEGR